MWNSLPDEVVSAPSVNVFKARLDKYWSEYYFTLEPEDFLYTLTSDQPMYDVAHQKAKLMYIKQMMTQSHDAVARAPCVHDSVNNTHGSEAAGIAEVSCDSAAGRASFASLTCSLAQDSTAFQKLARARKNKLIVGASSVNKRLKAAMTKRSVDVSVSRLHPETPPHELVDCVHSVGDGLKICDVTSKECYTVYLMLASL